MQINPKRVIDEGWLIKSIYTQVQQVGIDCTLAEEVILPPKSCKNVEFNEKFHLPLTVFATPGMIRSSYSRMGIFCSSGVYDPYYGGNSDQGAPAGCTLYNMSDVEVTIKRNERILQFIFWEADAAAAYQGHYNNTESIRSKIVGSITN